MMLMNHELKLRALEPADAEMMYHAEEDEAAWIYSDYLAPLSMELLRQYALTYDADPMRSGQLRLIIDMGGTPVGIFDLFEISPRHLRAETGIYILPPHRHSGIGHKALLLAKDYCRRRLGLHQLSASIAQKNKDALLCYRKAGFFPSGIRPDWLRTPDGWETVEIHHCLL